MYRGRRYTILRSCHPTDRQRAYMQATGHQDNTRPKKTALLRTLWRRPVLRLMLQAWSVSSYETSSREAPQRRSGPRVGGQKVHKEKEAPAVWGVRPAGRGVSLIP